MVVVLGLFSLLSRFNNSNRINTLRVIKKSLFIVKIWALYGWTKRMRNGHIDHRLYYTDENGFQFIRILTTQQARRIVHLKKKNARPNEWTSECTVLHQRKSLLPSRVANWRWSYLRHKFQMDFVALPCKRHHPIDLKYSRDIFLILLLFFSMIFSIFLKANEDEGKDMKKRTHNDKNKLNSIYFHDDVMFGIFHVAQHSFDLFYSHSKA